MDVTIRPARLDELEALRDIERAAGRAFADIGMELIADDEPPSALVLAIFRQACQLWVAADDDGRPVAYAMAETVDGCAHVEQVSVHPVAAGHRIGSRLLDTVAEWGATRRFPAVTLTTFRDVPWNAPYYARLGFSVLHELGPELAALVAHEAEAGLDPEQRVCMRRDIPARASKV